MVLMSDLPEIRHSYAQANLSGRPQAYTYCKLHDGLCPKVSRLGTVIIECDTYRGLDHRILSESLVLVSCRKTYQPTTTSRLLRIVRQMCFFEEVLEFGESIQFVGCVFLPNRAFDHDRVTIDVYID